MKRLLILALALATVLGCDRIVRSEPLTVSIELATLQRDAGCELTWNVLASRPDTLNYRIGRYAHDPVIGWVYEHSGSMSSTLAVTWTDATAPLAVTWQLWHVRGTEHLTQEYLFRDIRHVGLACGDTLRVSGPNIPSSL